MKVGFSGGSDGWDPLESFTLPGSHFPSSSTPKPYEKKKCPFCGGAMYKVIPIRTDPPSTITYECSICRFCALFRIRSKVYPEP